MKKIIVILTIFILFLGGCGNKNNNTNNESGNNEQENTADKLIIDGYDLSLTEESTFNEMSYKYPSRTTVTYSIGTAEILNYPKMGSDESLFRIALGKMYNSVEEAMKGDTFTKVGTKRIGNYDWEIYNDKDNNHSYAYYYNHETYVISFVSTINIDEFESELLKTVEFK